MDEQGEILTKPENFWGQAYGREYDRKWKQPLVDELEEMSASGDLGKVVLDIGSGKRPVTLALGSKHKVVSLDIAHKENRTTFTGQWLQVKANAGDTKLQSYDTKRAAVEIAHFLGLTTRELRDNPAVADAIVMSEILNYIDWREVIPFLSQFLKTDGKLIICNMPGRGVSSVFHPTHPQTTQEVLDFLESADFEVEKDVGLRIGGSTDSDPKDKSLHMIIARKKT